MSVKHLPRHAWLRGATALVTLLAVTLTAAPAHAAESLREQQWFWEPMKLDQAHRISQGAGVVVGLLDTGLDRTNIDLKGATLPGQDVVADKAPGNFDEVHHGTAMAGIIAGRGHGAGGLDGVVGIAPEAKVMLLQPIDDPMYTGQAIRWATAHGAKIINMSFRISPSESLHAAIRDARAAGVLLVASAGNGEYGNAIAYPAAYPEVLAVASLGRDNKVLGNSTYGPQVDLSAPGDEIPGPTPGNKYALETGTSSASAIVSGAAALIWSQYPDLTVDEVEARLLGTVTDRGAKGRDDHYGLGQLNLMAALTGAQPPVTAEPVKPSASAQQSAFAAPTPLKPVDQGLPGWLFLVAIAVVLLIIVALIVSVVLIARRRRRPA
ncbi:S8 family serine peptidase [Winogradskya humida]|uniref:S8 family serine peptidase n=1 Tax=Winogradskya humida TaxID=113566 RepID=UPI001942D9C2|nr:S8 family serine peptidase [Actinoplanes humidus]